MDRITSMRVFLRDALLAAAVAGQGIIYQPHFIVCEAANLDIARAWP